MSEELLKTKRKAKTEDAPEKKIKLESASTTFEVQPEVENFQREALWRSLQDYKRRATHSQEQLDKLRKTSLYHDDHLRIIDLWWDQLLDEIQSIVRAEGLECHRTMNGVSEKHFLDTVPEFTEHITSKREGIINFITTTFKGLHADKRETSDHSGLESQNRDLMARLKIAEMNAKKLQLEKDDREPKFAELQDRLATAHRKVDRQKSITLARIEQQARKVPGSQSPMNPIKNEEDNTTASNIKGTNEATNGHATAVEHASLNAAIEKHMQELATLQTQLAASKEQNASLQRRIDAPTESDIMNTEAFRGLKKANEHLRGQNEFLETQYQTGSKEVGQLKSEREEFRKKIEEEFATQSAELASQLSRTEQDLARVRSNRDELHSSLQVKKGQDDLRSASAREISELADTQATRIAALEAEVLRLKKEYPEDEEEEMQSDGSDNVESLQALLAQLRRENKSLKNELPTMEQAFNQANEQNMRKIMDLATTEERVSRLQAEKQKADQKYFAAMKAKDQLSFELKAAKTSASKSSEAVTRLHEAEEASKERVSNLERQVVLLEEACEQYKLDLSKASAQADEWRILQETKTRQLGDALGRAEGKEQEVASLSNARRTMLQELEQLKVLHEKSTLQSDAKPALESEQVQVYKGIAMCSVCSTRWKNTALVSCGHVFCKECIDKRVETRQRRCPNCNKGFGSGDVLSVHL